MIARILVGLAYVGLCAFPAQAADNIPLGQRQKICLNGVWDFAAAGTSATEIPTDGWGELRVPSSWVGYGPVNFSVSSADAAANHAWFRRTFFVPKDWSDGRRVKLLFLDLDWAHKVFVNGDLVDEYPAMRLCFEVDITSHVKFGEDNVLTVWTAKSGDDDMEGGIVRSVYLTSVPAVHVEYSHALPSVKDMTLTVKTRVKNEDAVARTVTVKPAVRDNGTTVIELPQVSAEIEPGQSVELETAAPWKDPVLWGFGPYGRPYLYHLSTRIDGDAVADQTFDRFGFREFRTEGAKFLFNGKEYFVKGDLISRAWPVTEDPSFVAAWYQTFRSANINFQRLHGHHGKCFESHYWYQVGDELGHLVEAQLNLTRPAQDDPEHLKLWTTYVNYHFNHPSLVMWCPDNESVRLEQIMEDPETTLPPWNRLAGHVRGLDPTRIVDFHYGWSLFAGVHLGLFDRENFMTFNTHPYGNLQADLQKQKKSVEFDDSVPTLIGEVYNFPSAIDMLGDPAGSFVEQRRRGEYWASNIAKLAEVGAAGTILCSLEASGFVGYTKPGQYFLGPWSDRCLIRDETKPDKPPVAERICRVKVRWPSLSGEGTKSEVTTPYSGSAAGRGGYGDGINWFDPTVPIFRPCVTDRMVAQAYGKIGGEEPKLGPHRAVEVVVCYGREGQPVKGAYVHLVPEYGQATPDAVATDADGTAWLRLWDTGNYTAVVEDKGERFEKPLTIEKRPELTGQAGYGHLVWVDFGGIDVAKRQTELAQPAEFTDFTLRSRDELLTGGDMEYWLSDNQACGWQQSGQQEKQNVKSGKYSARLTGNLDQMVRLIQMTPGHLYRISGWIYKKSGNNYGCIGIRDGKWDWLLKLDGSTEPDTWQYVQNDYRAVGGERYFYCFNYYMDEAGECLFDDISVQVVDEKQEATPFQPGPFEVGDDGFVGHWLICGPFPNLLVEEGESSAFLGHRQDLLKDHGGEATARPAYGQTVTAQFPEGGAWLEGQEVLTWRDVHGGQMFSFQNLALPSRGITAQPPTLVCAYAACIIESPVARKVKVAVGSDDGNKVFLNGKLVGENEVMRAAEADQDIYPAELKQGENILLVKIFQHIGGWEFCLRFLDEQNKPVRDLKIKLPE